nr:MAG TPA: hypothetical protein [Caudoviricetes sp.]
MLFSIAFIVNSFARITALAGLKLYSSISKLLSSVYLAWRGL